MKYELVVGMDKGHKVTRLPKIAKKRSSGKVRKHVKSLIREVAGFAPYEKRAMELLRIGKEKRCLKFLKKRLGKHTAGKRKREEMQNVLQAMRKQQKAKETKKEETKA